MAVLTVMSMRYAVKHYAGKYVLADMLLIKDLCVYFCFRCLLLDSSDD